MKVIFPAFPKRINDELLHAYNEILKNYRERRWEPSELNGGKLCETVYTIINGYIAGKIPEKTSKPRNFIDSCRKLEQLSNDVPHSLKTQIPRILLSLYEIRNHRGVGHAGGDVDPNQMDAIAVLYMSKWLMAELVRVFHNVDTDMAQTMVEKIVEINMPLIWEVDGKLRILENYNYKDATLILLYHSQKGLRDRELVDNLEHSNLTVYRNRILKSLHKERLIEYNNTTEIAKISPKGTEHVEKNILNNSK